jgi:NTE family protein
MTQYPFRNLVFQGGGIRSFVYHGALKALEERGVLPQIERVAGTSAGAMLAAIISFRLSVDESLAIFRSLDVSKVPQTASRDDMDMPDWVPVEMIKRELQRLTGGAGVVTRLVKRYGWYSTDYAHSWIEDVIATQCDGNGRATFGVFRERGFRDLHVIATNVSTRREEVFSADTTPDVAVADALIMSQSIPFFFEAIRFDGQKIGEGDFYADGGIVHNFPVELFDFPRYAFDEDLFLAGINWETLGCRHYQPHDCPQNTRTVTGLLSYMENLIQMLIEGQARVFNHSRVNRRRTINISNLCVGITDFSVTPHEDNEMYQKLVREGHEMATEFLDEWDLDVIKSAEPISTASDGY